LAQATKVKPQKPRINTLPFYVALVVLFVLFILFQGKGDLSEIFGIALFLMIVVIIVLEVTLGIEEEGYVKNIIEIGIAVLAVVVFWFALRAVLHTAYPLDVVPSCSMLPNLKRGDLIALQGLQSINQISAPRISITTSQYNTFNNNIQNEFLSCVAYQVSGNRVAVSQIIRPGYSIGLYESTPSGGQIVQQAQQQGNLIQYTCGSRGILFDNGTTEQEAYTTAVTINGTTIYGDKNNSIVVYATTPSDYFYKLGDSYIVHRAFAVLNVSGKYYVLTKGDNNPGLDLQYGNYPSNMSFIEGKVVASIPYLGYLKLALSNSFVEPSGCNSTVQGN
jgi:hypothetical protein